MPPGHQTVDEHPPVTHRLHLGARLLRLVAGQWHRIRLGAVQGPALREPGSAGRREARGVGAVRAERASRRRGSVLVTRRRFDRTRCHRSVTSSDERSFRTRAANATAPGFTHKGVPGTIRLRERGLLCCSGREPADGGGGGSTPQIRRVALHPCPVCLKSSPRWRPCGPPSGPSPGTRSVRSRVTRTRRSRGSCSPSTRSRRSSTRRWSWAPTCSSPTTPSTCAAPRPSPRRTSRAGSSTPSSRTTSRCTSPTPTPTPPTRASPTPSRAPWTSGSPGRWSRTPPIPRAAGAWAASARWTTR